MRKINWFTRLFMSWNQLEAYFENNQNDSKTLDALENAYKEQIKTLNERNAELNTSLAKVSEQVTRLEEQNNSKDRELDVERNSLVQLKTQLSEVRVKLDERTGQSKELQNEIRDQLKTIGKIEKTFFASTGNKGKGEMGEVRVRLILEKSGLENNMWVENLSVGNDVVEFAMVAGEEGKFIPIDSKVLEANIDDEGNAIIDVNYKNKVSAAAKAVAKYLGKANTADYGILVLQSDEIYMKLFEEFPNLFQEIVTSLKIHVMSPSSFVQQAWSISHLIEIYKRVHNDEKIYEQMVTTIDSVSKFAHSLQKVHKEFNTTMKHYGTIENKSSKLLKKLNKEGKIKELPLIGNSDIEEE